MRLTENQRTLLYYLLENCNRSFSLSGTLEFSNKLGISKEDFLKDAEELVRKGYLVRNNSHSKILRARKSEILFGRWFSDSEFGNFMMYIFGKQRKESIEEIGGDIADGLGSAHFWGKRWDRGIEFTKLYDSNSCPFTADGEIIYQGKGQKNFYQGRYNFMQYGEFLREGRFILVRGKKDLILT